MFYPDGAAPAVSRRQRNLVLTEYKMDEIHTVTADVFLRQFNKK
jgi:hypothetical protein